MPVIKLREWLERNDFVNVSKGGKILEYWGMISDAYRWNKSIV